MLSEPVVGQCDGDGVARSLSAAPREAANERMAAMGGLRARDKQPGGRRARSRLARRVGWVAGSLPPGLQVARLWDQEFGPILSGQCFGLFHLFPLCRFVTRRRRRGARRDPSTNRHEELLLTRRGAHAQQPRG